MTQRFLILHGLTGAGPGHWQLWVADRLRTAGAWVSMPDLPDRDAPQPSKWEAALASALVGLADGGGERVVVCHSLGSVLWLRHSKMVSVDVRPDRVLLVAPPSPSAGLAEIASFFPVASDRQDVSAAAGRTLLVCSDNDPYCPEGASTAYGDPLGIETQMIKGGEHLNIDAGYGPWPHVEAWCLGRGSTILG